MTYFALVTLCLVTGAVGFLLRRKTTPIGNGLVATACLGVATLVGWQVFRFSSVGAARPVDRAYAAVAYHLGYEIMGSLRGVRGTIGLILPPENRANRPALDSAFDTLARVLAPLPDLALKELTLSAPLRQIDGGTVPWEAFEQALAAAPNALAYVSFTGLPRETDRLSLWNQVNPPPLFVFDPSGGTNWLAPLKQGRLKRVILPRPELWRQSGRLPTAGPPDEIFQRWFQWATPDNADAIADALAVRSAAR